MVQKRTGHIRLHTVRLSPKVLPLKSDVHFHFQEKEQSDYEKLMQVLQKEQDIYTHLVKSLQDSDR